MLSVFKRIGRALGLVAKPTELTPFKISWGDIRIHPRCRCVVDYDLAAPGRVRGGAVNIPIMGRIGDGSAEYFLPRDRIGRSMFPPSISRELAADAKLQKASDEFAAVILEALQND